MDKIYIRSLIKNTNYKNSKKEIVELLDNYLKYIYTVYYIYLDDYISNIKVKSLNENFLKSDKKYIQHAIMDNSDITIY